jgi:type I restriction-modification system DNA methylase subunit
VLIKILENLNYPFSPYHFNEIGVEILGSIYEKFLGKTIHLAPKNVIIKDKPEVRKAGGVYYTPQYIVKYIVDNTLGKLLYEDGEKRSPLLIGEGQGEVPKAKPTLEPPVVPLKGGQLDRRTLKLSPKQVAKLKIIDIACGSGSFLLGAFQKLIDYHIEWYTAHTGDIKTENNVPDAYKDTDGNYHLSPRKKRDILVNNIYGVDIDRQAVEVTQMSLYLKVLEGENAETLNPQMTLALKEVYLPSLAKNIKCGNSLIGTDFTSQGEMFDDEMRRKVNPFDWEMEFPEILGSKQTPTLSPPQRGGDVQRTEGVEGSRGFDVVIGNPPYGAIIDEASGEYFDGRFKLYGSIKDIYLLFIEKSISVLKGQGFLGYIIPSAWTGGPQFESLRKLLLEQSIEKIVLLPYDVFSDAYIDTSLLVIKKGNQSSRHSVRTYIYGKKAKLSDINISEENYQKILQDEWNDKGNKFILDGSVLHLLKSIRKNIELDYDSVVSIKRGVLFDKKLLLDKKKGNNSYKYFEGDVYRYQVNKIAKHWIEFDDRIKERPKELSWFEGKRILLRRLVNRQQRLMSSLVLDTFITNKNLYSILPKEKYPSIEAILGILNSKLISYLYLNQITQATKDDFPQVTIQDVLKLPFPNLKTRQQQHDDLVLLVEKMLELNKQLQKAHFDSEKEPIERQIAATDKKIDDIVYELYGLTEEEIKIVEG